MKKFSSFIDSVLTFAALWLFAAAVTGYFTRNRTAVILSSATAAAALTYFIRLLVKRRQAPKHAKRKRDGILNKLMFSKSEYAHGIALQAISKKCTPQVADGLILGGKTAFKVSITPQKITAAFIAEAYAAAAALNAAKLVIMSAYGCDESANAVVRLLESPQVEVWDFEKTYGFFASVGCAPTQTMTLAPKKKALSAVLNSAVKRENAKRYLFGAIILLMWARFIPYSVAYVAAASVCIALAMVCLLRGNGAFKRR